MKLNSYKSRALQRRVMEHLRGEYRNGVRVVYYIALSEALKVPVKQLRAMLMPIGGGSDGIQLNGEMFHRSEKPPATP